MTSGTSLLEVVQSLLERTFRMNTGVSDIGKFVIGDRGYRRLYGGSGEAVPCASSPAGARTLVRETADAVRLCIYYPDEMILRLECYPPQRGLSDENVDAFATLVEEVDHLLSIAERAREAKPVTLFELELHANVSKYLVLARFLAGAGRPLDARRRAWLRYHLFHRGTHADEDPEARARYRDAARWAFRLLEAVAPLRPADRVAGLRRFHAATAGDKLELIRSIAA